MRDDAPVAFGFRFIPPAGWTARHEDDRLLISAGGEEISISGASFGVP